MTSASTTTHIGRRLFGAAAVVMVAAVMAVACANGSDSDGSPSTAVSDSSSPTTGSTSDGEDEQLGPLPKIELVEVGRFDQPVAMAVRPDGVAFVAEKTGRVRRLDSPKGDPLVDVSRLVSSGNEQGLLGLAFAPDGLHFYLDYTDRDGDTRVVEYDSAGRNAREVLAVEQPFANHNGGQLAFGPDGMLYVSLGDGGSGGDPKGNAQDLSSRLGKILRLDPRPSGSQPFTVPKDNPFVGREGADPLIWLYGLRNPWRFSFDRSNGDLWIADVGQGDWEEVDLIPSGAGGGNLGWNRLEGTHFYSRGVPADAIAPVHEYDHSSGACSVTGGFRSRGPLLAGAYVFGDFCDGQVRALRSTGTGSWKADLLGVKTKALAAFGEGTDGTLYVLSLDGPVSRMEAA